MNDVVMLSPIYDSYWILPGRLRVGEYPGSASDDVTRMKLRWLLAGGINIIIDLTEQGEAGLKPYDRLFYAEALKFTVSAHHIRLPLPDFSTPPEHTMVEILDMIDLGLSLGKKIYLHCHGGKGRTGTVAGCYLVRQGLTGQEALDQLKMLRVGIPSHAEPSPETAGQRRMVLEWNRGQ